MKSYLMKEHLVERRKLLRQQIQDLIWWRTHPECPSGIAYTSLQVRQSERTKDLQLVCLLEDVLDSCCQHPTNPRQYRDVNINVSDLGDAGLQRLLYPQEKNVVLKPCPRRTSKEE